MVAAARFAIFAIIFQIAAADVGDLMSGWLNFGPQTETNLYRTIAPGVIKTDNSLVVSGNITAGASEINLLASLADLQSQLTTLKSSTVALSVFMAHFIYTPTQISVATSGGQFSSLAAAWNWVQTKVIGAPLIIKIYDGTYTSGQLTFNSVSNPQLITIEGNPDNPRAVVFRSQGPAAFVFEESTSGMTITGLWISGNNANSGYGIIAQYNTYVNAYNIVVSGKSHAFEAFSDAGFYLHQCTVSNVGTAVLVASFSYALIETMTVNNAQFGIIAERASSINVDAELSLSNINKAGVVCDNLESAVTGTDQISFGASVSVKYDCSVHD